MNKTRICFDIEDGTVHNVQFINGCPGNTQGVAALSEGMEVKEVIRRLKGLLCRNGTSCPNEFAKALEASLAD